MLKSWIVNKLIGHNFLHTLISWLCINLEYIKESRLSILALLHGTLTEPTFEHQKQVFLGSNCLWVMATNALFN